MKTTLILITVFFLSGIPAWPGFAADPVVIGLNADMSSGSARSGIAVKRGIILAMDEINTGGGILGRKLRLLVRDHRGNPARGVDNLREMAGEKHLAAVIGGLHTPVALAELPVIHENKLIYLGPWAAGTPVVKNGYDPNFVFRVSVRDEFAGPFLAGRAVDAYGYEKPGFLLEQTGWGRSNHKAMTRALTQRGMAPAGVKWFLWGTDPARMGSLVASLKEDGADVILFVGNSPEGAALIRAMAELPAKQQLPVISHWGITGGNFFRETKGKLDKVDLVFLQTFSFLKPRFPRRAAKVFEAYRARWPEAGTMRDIFAPAGTAHAYDLVHLLKKAVEKAGSLDSEAVRKALENLGPTRGLVKNYDPPFTAHMHDALDAGDFRLARYAEDGAIVPVD